LLVDHSAVSARHLTYKDTRLRLLITSDSTGFVSFGSLFCNFLKVAGSTRKPANKIHTKTLINIWFACYKAQI
jgi:hypothetical protein